MTNHPPSRVTIAKRCLAVVMSATLAIPGFALQLQGQSEEAHTRIGRLNAVLPADVAQRILDRITAAQSQGLPGELLEQRALKFAAKGIPAQGIETAIAQHADRMTLAQKTLRPHRGGAPQANEIDACADLFRRGVNASQVSSLASSVSSGRSLAVPLYVIGSLIDRGLPANDALSRVRIRLQERADDSAIEGLIVDMQRPSGPEHTNRGVGQGKGKGPSQRPPHAGSGPGGNRGVGRGADGTPPRGVPANPGQGRGNSGKPDNPGRGGKP